MILSQLTAGIVTHSLVEVDSVAQALAAVLKPNTILALHGSLGAGKTTFIAALAAALGVREAVTSPTFTIINTYKGRYHFVHMDAYRLQNADALEALCLESLLIEPYCFALEWPENIADALPADALHLYFDRSEEGTHTIRLG